MTARGHKRWQIPLPDNIWGCLIDGLSAGLVAGFALVGWRAVVGPSISVASALAETLPVGGTFGVVYWWWWHRKARGD
jgi:hypothetical protein